MEELDETQDARMVKMEKAISHISCELALLRQHVDSQFSAMKQYIDSSIVTLRLEIQLYVQAEVQKAVDKLLARIEAGEKRQAGFNHWMIGLLITILLGQIALLAHSLLG